MEKRVFLIHGWSVNESTTYQALHLQLAKHGFTLQDIFLGRYVSLQDNIEIRDISKALHRALDEVLDNDWSRPFHIVTHSTGALIVRHWIVQHYNGEYCRSKPLHNLVFLAAPHFGSRLAHHGHSMLAYARYLGDTGSKILKALELGSRDTWKLAEQWGDVSHWHEKGIRPFNLIGDRVKRDYFKKKIFPAAYEQGSDMVVRVAAGNLNYRHYVILAKEKKVEKVGEIASVPFGSLAEFTHSGQENGIMNSIKKRTSWEKHTALRLILQCLEVESESDYSSMQQILAKQTQKTREKKPGYAQIIFRFRDEQGEPVNDYVFSLGYYTNSGEERASKAVEHLHKNSGAPSFLTVFIKVDAIEKDRSFFLRFDSKTGTDLLSYFPDPLEISFSSETIQDIVRPDQTTLIDVILARNANKNLFVFHDGKDEDLHVRWDRHGHVIDTKIEIK